METSWYNFKTGEFEFRSDTPTTDEEARQYIYQDEAAQAIYGIHRKMGDSILDALLATLKAQVGER